MLKNIILWNAYALKEVEVAVEQQHLPELHTTSGGCNQGWIGDGYCDDVNNNLDCTYDGGDCCLDYVYEDYCDECLCLEWILMYNAIVGLCLDWFLLCRLSFIM